MLKKNKDLLAGVDRQPDELSLAEDIETADDTTRFWRFRADTVFRCRDGQSTAFTNPVPVLSAGKLVGFASLNDTYGYGIPIVEGQAAVVYGLPERLTAQNGEPVWLVPNCRIFRNKGLETVTIESLELRTDPRRDLTPIQTLEDP